MTTPTLLNFKTKNRPSLLYCKMVSLKKKIPIDKTCFYNLRRKWNFMLILHPKNDNSWWIFEPKNFGQLKTFFTRNLASTVNPRHKLSNMRDLYWEWSSSSKASITSFIWWPNGHRIDPGKSTWGSWSWSKLNLLLDSSRHWQNNIEM